MSRLTVAALITGLSLVALSGRASAAICVDSAGSGSCFTTIQLGVNNAVAGETINIKAGVYFENVVIPPGRDGLTIKGSRTTILDPGADSDAATVDNTGVGIIVRSNDVTITGFTIRNGDSHAIELADSVTGTEISKMRFVHCGDECIVSADVGNDRTTVAGCSFFGMENVGSIRLTGNEIEIVQNSVLGGDNDPLEVNGDDTIFERNTIQMTGNDTHCTEFNGDRVEVVNNTIENCGDEAIEISGADALVSGNKIQGSEGIEVDGDNPVITKNQLIDVSGGEGLDVSCTICAEAVISGNKLLRGADGVEGLEIDADGPGITIEKNIVEQFTDDAFDLDILDGTVTRNRAINSSAVESDSCFSISGDGNTFEGNSASGCSEGFEITGDDNTLTKNSAVGGSRDGFEVRDDAAGTTLSSNTSVGNAGLGFGIRDGTTGTTLTDNRASGNHTDFCDDAVGTIESGNRFVTEVANVVPGDENDDCPPNN